MKAILRSGFLALAIMALAVPAHAGPLEDGVAAYDRGDYETALRLLRPLAEQGFSKAQVTLGYMYDNGEGVPQDYVSAHLWFNLAAAQGYVDGLGFEDAREKRDELARIMTPDQIAEAQRMARDWMAKHQQ